MEEEQIAREEARKERQRQRDLDRLARRSDLGSDLGERTAVPLSPTFGTTSTSTDATAKKETDEILRAEAASLRNLTSTLMETISKLQVALFLLQGGQDSLLSELAGAKQQLTTLRKLYDISVVDLEAEHERTQRINAELAEARQDRDTAEDLASSQLEEIETLQETVKVLSPHRQKLSAGDSKVVELQAQLASLKLDAETAEDLCGQQLEEIETLKAQLAAQGGSSAIVEQLSTRLEAEKQRSAEAESHAKQELDALKAQLAAQAGTSDAMTKLGHELAAEKESSAQAQSRSDEALANAQEVPARLTPGSHPSQSPASHSFNTT